MNRAYSIYLSAMIVSDSGYHMLLHTSHATVFGNKGVNTPRAVLQTVWNKEPFAASNDVTQTRICVYADVKGAGSDER